MSYILNALRKSEQERRNREQETLQHRLAEIQLHTAARTSIWVLMLVIINVALLGYFVWDYYRKVPESVASTKPQEQSQPHPVIETEARVGQASSPQAGTASVPESVHPPAPLQRLGNQAERALSVPKIDQQTDTAQPVIADLNKPQQLPAISRPAADSMDVDDPATRHASEPVIVSKRSPEAEFDRIDAETASKEPEYASDMSAIPYIFELPYELRKQIPPLTINVFVYSERAADSFVMIDMKKYKIGQRIKDELEVEEIRSHSLVLRYRDRVFQIKRP
ncbi:MAG: general secretion pathway protein GspB [Gammaproteobacteria bacterium]